VYDLLFKRFCFLGTSCFFPLLEVFPMEYEAIDKILAMYRKFVEENKAKKQQ
jgi:hypothetical protein